LPITIHATSKNEVKIKTHNSVSEENESAQTKLMQPWMVKGKKAKGELLLGEKLRGVNVTAF